MRGCTRWAGTEGMCRRECARGRAKWLAQAAQQSGRVTRCCRSVAGWLRGSSSTKSRHLHQCSCINPAAMCLLLQRPSKPLPCLPLPVSNAPAAINFLLQRPCCHMACMPLLRPNAPACDASAATPAPSTCQRHPHRTFSVLRCPCLLSPYLQHPCCSQSSTTLSLSTFSVC